VSTLSEDDFTNTIKYLHLWSANAAYFTIKAAYDSAGSGRSCNTPPRFDSFSVTSPSSGQIQVTFDPDQDLAQYIVHWGDGTTSGWQSAGDSSDSQTETKTGFVDGSTYQIAVLIEDNNAFRARNVKFIWVTVGEMDYPPSAPTGLRIQQ
jgi:hypothetical protein